jgi:transcription elongation factor SPT6
MDDRGGYEDDMDRFIDDDEDEDEGLDDNRHNRREKAPVKPRARRAPIEGLSEEYVYYFRRLWIPAISILMK